jgi:hypothetical protein
MTDLSFSKLRRFTGEDWAAITPNTVEATVWLSDKIILLVELDKPVTLSLDGALEIEAMARIDGLAVEGL